MAELFLSHKTRFALETFDPKAEARGREGRAVDTGDAQFSFNSEELLKN